MSDGVVITGALILAAVVSWVIAWLVAGHYDDDRRK
jgi:hypothetical protein